MLTVPRLPATWMLARMHFVHYGLKKPVTAFCARPLEWSSTEYIFVLPKMGVLLKSLLGFIVAHAALLQGGSLVFKCNLGIKEGNWECERERSGKREMAIRGNRKDSGNKILEITYCRVK